jgi:hypothetical protein
LYLADRIEDNFFTFCFSVLKDVVPVDKAVTVVDSIQCSLKLLLKELLSKVSYVVHDEFIYAAVFTSV